MSPEALELAREGFNGRVEVRFDQPERRCPDLNHFSVKVWGDATGVKSLQLWGCFVKAGMDRTASGRSCAQQAAEEESGHIVSELLENSKEILGVDRTRAFWIYRAWAPEAPQFIDLAAGLVRVMQLCDVYDADPHTLRAVHLHPPRLTGPRSHDWQSDFSRFGFQPADDTVFEAIGHFALGWPQEFMVMGLPRRGSFLYQLQALA